MSKPQSVTTSAPFWRNRVAVVLRLLQVDDLIAAPLRTATGRPLAVHQRHGHKIHAVWPQHPADLADRAFGVEQVFEDILGNKDVERVLGKRHRFDVFVLRIEPRQHFPARFGVVEI
jgi:hypothetical protein